MDLLRGIAGEFDVQFAFSLRAYIRDDEWITAQGNGDVCDFAGRQSPYRDGLAVLLSLTGVMKRQLGIAPSLTAVIDDAERSIVICTQLGFTGVLDLFRIEFWVDGYGRAGVVDGDRGIFCPAVQTAAVSEILGADIVFVSLRLRFRVSCWRGNGVCGLDWLWWLRGWRCWRCGGLGRSCFLCGRGFFFWQRGAFRRGLFIGCGGCGGVGKFFLSQAEEHEQGAEQ